MKKLTASKIKWLKILHLFIIALWIGTGFVLGVLAWVGPTFMKNGIYTVYTIMEMMDTYLMRPLVIVTLITGLAFSLFTNWGFFKHRWITVKWIVLFIQILTGALFLAPIIQANASIARMEQAEALNNTTFLSNQTLIHIGNIVQLSLLFYVICISVLKPWKKGK